MFTKLLVFTILLKSSFSIRCYSCRNCSVVSEKDFDKIEDNLSSSACLTTVDTRSRAVSRRSGVMTPSCPYYIPDNKDVFCVQCHKDLCNNLRYGELMKMEATFPSGSALHPISSFLILFCLVAALEETL